MDPLQQLDLPLGTSSLPPGEQKALITERYIQLIARTERDEEKLLLQEAWQQALIQADDEDPWTSKNMTEWVAAGQPLGDEPVETLQLDSAAHETKSTLLDREFEQSDAGTTVTGYQIPCPFGHQHVYDCDNQLERTTLLCPSCKVLFTALIQCVCEGVETFPSLSAREREWSVDTRRTPHGRVQFRGPSMIDVQQGDTFSLIAGVGTRSAQPLWLVNHSRRTQWALSGSGLPATQPQRSQPPSSKKLWVLTYLLPFLLLTASLSFWFSPLPAMLIAAAVTVFIWRPWLAPHLLPLGETGIFHARRKVQR